MVSLQPLPCLFEGSVMTILRGLSRVRNRCCLIWTQHVGCAITYKVLIERDSEIMLLGHTGRYKNQLIGHLQSPLPGRSCPACESTADTPSDISSIRQHCGAGKAS